MHVQSRDMLPVLVIDPDTRAASQLAASLRALGIEVRIAADADAAWALLTGSAFSVAVVFADLRDALCVEFIGELRRRRPQLWLLVVAAAPGGSFGSPAAAIGADALLSSALPLERIAARVVALTRRSRPAY